MAALTDGQLKDLINGKIRPNKREAISGESLNEVLQSMREFIGASGSVDTNLGSTDLTASEDRIFNQDSNKLTFTNASQLKLIANAIPPIGESSFRVEGYSTSDILEAVSPSSGQVFRVRSTGIIDIKNKLQIGPNGYQYGLEMHYPSNASQGCMRIYNGGVSMFDFRMSSGNPSLYMRDKNGVIGINLQAAAASEFENDIQINNSAKGIALKDRTTGSYYRIYVDSGVFGIESV